MADDSENTPPSDNAGSTSAQSSPKDFVTESYAPIDPGAIPPTEDGVAEEFAWKYAEKVCFCPETNSWYFWDGQRWKLDKDRAFHLIRMIGRDRRGTSRQMSTSASVEGAERMAQKDPRFVRHIADWDNAPLLLGTPNGTVDLQTGQVMDPKNIHYITKHTSVAPAPPGTPCPAFDNFLNEVTNGDVELQAFLIRFCGYCLTGETKEQVLLFIFGPGGNGKTVFQNVLFEILGDYARPAAVEMFTSSRQNRHLSELAMLKGARMVTAAETEQGQFWPEARIKLLTGGEDIAANFMRQDHFTYRPDFKLIFTGNHKPQLRAVSEAMRRRFILVRFDFKPKSPDPDLSAKLRNEYPAILRKFIEGAVEWGQVGLKRPESVQKVTSEYFDEENTFGHWLSENCTAQPNAQTSATTLYNDWKSFCQERGEEPGSMKAFAARMLNSEFKKKTSGNVFWLNVVLKQPGFPGLDKQNPNQDC